TAAATCVNDDQCGMAQLCLQGACSDIRAGIAECASVQVHFDTDSAAIRDDDRPALRRMARCLKASQSIKLTIATSADERGTSEHNADLSERRAKAVSGA